MKIKRIILIIISIMCVSFIQLNVISSYTETIPGIALYDGTSIRETKYIYHPPQIFNIDIPKGTIGIILLLFIQSLFGIFLQIYIIYIMFKKFILKEDIDKENYKVLMFLIVIFYIYVGLFLI